MKIGIFDHLDRDTRPVSELYASRLRLVEAYERAGIDCYHLAEHHFTPLGMAPSPSVFLASVAAHTRRIKFGPLVYTLALYHPLRLAEEVAMLDHLSNGRFQLGIGRGISPLEVGFFGVDPAQAQKRYFEAYKVMMQALSQDIVTHKGEYFEFNDVPVAIHSLQRPHPPLWYGLALPDGAPWAAENKVNVVSLLVPKAARAMTDRYRAEWAKLGRPAAELPKLGLARHMVIADTDAEALAIARRAYKTWRASFWHLWLKHNKSGVMPPYNPFPETFDELLEQDKAVAGSPETVRKNLLAQVDGAGANYCLIDIAFSDLSETETLRSLDLFGKHIAPALQ